MTSSAPMFSIIVPVFNTEQYLAQALGTICAQTYSDFECLVVNDGSTDHSEAIIDQYLVDPRFKKINQKNQGLSVARNSGLTEASGEYLLFLDSDDFFEPNLLAKVVEKVKQYRPDLVIYNSVDYNNQVDLDSDKNIKIDHPLILSGSPFNASKIKKIIFNSFFNSVWTKAFRHDFLLENNLLFNPKLHRLEDLPFTNQALILAKSICYLDDVLLHYRMNVKNSNTVTNSKYPDNLILAINELKDFLVEHKLLADYRQSFDNLVIHDIDYYFWWTAGSPVFSSLFMETKKLLTEFNFKELNPEYFYREMDYELKQIITEGTPEDYYCHCFGKMRFDLQNFETQLLQLRFEDNFLKTDYQKIKHTSAHYLARYLLRHVLKIGK